MRDGLRDAFRSRRSAEPAAPRHHSVPPVPAAPPSRPEFHQLADHLGEKQTGLTIFWPDNGLDTGPVLLQKTVDIAETDTLGSLYFDQLYPLGVEAMLEAVDQVRDGTAPKIPQNEADATYEGWCRREQVEIDWNQPLETVWNLIRGADPQPVPGARTGGRKSRSTMPANCPALQATNPEKSRLWTRAVSPLPR